MRIKPLLEKLTDKWPAKTICIVAACILYIFNQYTSLEQKTIPVALDVRQDGEMICSTHIPSNVSLIVRTNSDNITQVSAEGITASLDLSYYTEEGAYDAPVYVDLPASIKKLDPLQVTVYPEKIKVRLEKNVSRPIKVVPRSVGASPYGYTAKSLLSFPPYIEVIGPRSIVESITYLRTEAVDIENRTATFSQRKKIVNLDRLIRIDGSDDVLVTAEIDYAQGIKDFANFPILLRNLNSGFTIEGGFSADFSVSGPQLELDNYKPTRDALYLDLSGLREAGEYEVSVQFNIPHELHLESVSAEKVRVRLREKAAPAVSASTEGAPEGEGAVQEGGAGTPESAGSAGTTGERAE